MATKKTTKKAARKKSAKSKTTPSSKSTSENEHICAVLMYFIVGIVWYLVDEGMQKSSLVKFHLKQVLVLIIIDVAIGILLSILWFLWPIAWLLYLAICILWIIGLVYAIQKQEKELPLIGKFASHFKF